MKTNCRFSSKQCVKLFKHRKIAQASR